MTESELETLAQLLAGLGITLTLTDAEGHLLISAPPLRRDGSAETPRTVSMNLADGRRLVLSPDTEGERRNAEARQRFRVLAEHSSDLIVAVDADLAIRFASQAAATLQWSRPALFFFAAAVSRCRRDLPVRAPTRWPCAPPARCRAP